VLYIVSELRNTLWSDVKVHVRDLGREPGTATGLDHHCIHVDVISSRGREDVDIVGIVEVIVDIEHKKGRQIL
jgi:hypothetical protein